VPPPEQGDGSGAPHEPAHSPRGVQPADTRSAEVEQLDRHQYHEHIHRSLDQS
jgi:hypothetical protein